MTGAAFYSAVAFAVSAGVATFFAPCAFPLLPGYVGYYLRRGTDAPTLLSATAVSAGAVSALGGVSVLAYTFGDALTDVLPVFEPLVGLLLVAFGVLVLVGRAPQAAVRLPERPSSIAGFYAFGAVYALAAAGCVVPFFLGVVAQATAFPPARAGVVMGAYSLAVATPLVGVTLLASTGVDAWRGLGRHTDSLKHAAAALMILSGSAQLYVALAVFEAV